jgi:replicative DNA helicase
MESGRRNFLKKLGFFGFLPIVPLARGSEFFSSPEPNINNLFTKKTRARPSVGFRDLDPLIAEHQNHVIVLGARSGMGKTALANSMALNSAIGGKGTVAYFSLELLKEVLELRLLSGLSRVDLKHIRADPRLSSSNKARYLNEADFVRVIQAKEKIKTSNLAVYDNSFTCNEIRDRCRTLISKTGRLDLVIVDYLQLMRAHHGSGTKANRTTEITKIVSDLKTLAKDLQVPIFLLSQLNRSADRRINHIPHIRDLSEVPDPSNTFDAITFLHRPGYYDLEESYDYAHVYMKKTRNGPSGLTAMKWVPQYQLFEDHGGI